MNYLDINLTDKTRERISFLSHWLYLKDSWTTEPTLSSSVAGGDIWEYIYSAFTYYRFVPDPYDPSLDTFYSDLALLNPVASRSL